MTTPSNNSETVALRIPGLQASLHLYTHDARDKVVSQQIRTCGIWEPFETALVQRILCPGDVLVDVGANIGYFSVLGAALVGEGGHVIAVEPDPENCRVLRDNVAVNSLSTQVEVLEGAFSDRDASGQLFLSENNLGDHQLYATSDEARESVQVQLHNGSAYLRARTDRIDLLKIDTQGFEYAVIAGLMPLLKSLSAPTRILVELTPWSLRAAGASGHALIDLLATLSQPLWIVDHIEHQLVASSAGDLALWCDNVDACEGDRGFMNILVGPAP